MASRVSIYKTLVQTLDLRPHFFIGLALVALFWSASWGHWGVLGEYAFFPQWLGYILAVDALVAARASHSMARGGIAGGRHGSLLTSEPGHLLGLFLLSAPVWWLFESGNNYTQNWHYLVDKDYSRWHIILESTVDFSTVIPAVFETTILLSTFGLVRQLVRPRFHVRFSRLSLWGLMYLGAFMYLAIIFLPSLAFPFLWTWAFLLTDPLNWMRGRPSLLEQFSRGDFRLILGLALGTLVCAFFWEMWNSNSMPKWYYTVPYVGFFKIFEMPALGYLGYIPFAWELYALYQYIFGLLKIRTVL